MPLPSTLSAESKISDQSSMVTAQPSNASVWNDPVLVGDSFLYKPLNPFSALNSWQCCQYQVENSSIFRQTDCEGKERSAYNNTGTFSREHVFRSFYFGCLFMIFKTWENLICSIVTDKPKKHPIELLWTPGVTVIKLQVVHLPLLQLCTNCNEERTNLLTCQWWRNVLSTKTGHSSYSTDNTLHILW